MLNILKQLKLYKTNYKLFKINIQNVNINKYNINMLPLDNYKIYQYILICIKNI